MKCLWLFIIIVVFFLISGCADDDTAGSEERSTDYTETEKQEPALKEEDFEDHLKTGSVEIELTEYVSEDGRVSITIEKYLVDERIPEEAGSFFSGEKEDQAAPGDEKQGNENGIYFESSVIRLQKEDVYYLALFVTLNKVADGFLKIPHGYNDEQPVLITEEGTVHEKIITQFKYVGPADDYTGFDNLPAGSEGVVVFAYPIMESPAEIHYIYSLEEKNLPGAERGKIIVPVNALTNN